MIPRSVSTIGKRGLVAGSDLVCSGPDPIEPAKVIS
jgi:hypothetical protein